MLPLEKLSKIWTFAYLEHVFGPFFWLLLGGGIRKGHILDIFHRDVVMGHFFMVHGHDFLRSIRHIEVSGVPTMQSYSQWV